MTTAATRLAVVIGDPVEHSLSPALHSAAFAASGIDAVFVAVRVARDQLAAALAGLRAMGVLGISVTVPHKQAVMALVDRLDGLAARVGAVNCVSVAADGALVGHNTDAPGFVDSAGPVAGQRVVLLGAGGAARAVAAGLADAGVSQLVAVARRPDAVDWTRARPWTAEVLAELCPSCDLLVDCTSLGLDPAAEGRVPAAVPLERLPATARVATLVYHRDTALLAAARARGLAVLDGRAMLLHQGARAFFLWTGQPAPIDAMAAALDAALSRRSPAPR
jgi:shikimate dehydrogenase